MTERNERQRRSGEGKGKGKGKAWRDESEARTREQADAGDASRCFRIQKTFSRKRETFCWRYKLFRLVTTIT